MQKYTRITRYPNPQNKKVDKNTPHICFVLEIFAQKKKIANEMLRKPIFFAYL
jgi:hypothetical protein